MQGTMVFFNGGDSRFHPALSQPTIVKRLVLYGWLQGVAVFNSPYLMKD